MCIRGIVSLNHYFPILCSNMCLQRNESPVGTFINSPVSFFYSLKYKVSGCIKKGGIFSFLSFTWNWRQTDGAGTDWFTQQFLGREVKRRGEGREEKREGGRERGRERERVRGRWKGPRSSLLSWIPPKQSAESLLRPHMGSTEWSINTDNGNGHSKMPPAERKEALSPLKWKV